MVVALPPAVGSWAVDSASAVIPLMDRLWKFTAEYVLGTRLEMLVHSGSHASATLAAQAARAEIERLRQVLDHRRSDSEISLLHQLRRSTVSADLFSVLQLSETWRNLSSGAFDGRMGALLGLWATEAEPDQPTIERALAALQGSTIALDPAGRLVELSAAVSLSLDAVAKGYIVDAALDAARRAAPALEGIAISIGGDIRCWGRSPEPCGWRIGIPDPAIPAENSPLVDAVAISNGAIATSGLGPRDRVHNGYRSTTISPFDGQPVCQVISASVIASHVADADAIATACLVLPPEESLALVERLDGAAARITAAGGQVHRSKRWPAFQLAAATSDQTAQKQVVQSASANQPTQSTGSSSGKPSLPPQELRWPPDWELAVTYSLPEPQEVGDFRQPYIAMWISDAQNRPVTSLFLLGTDPKWARDNYIWWGSHDARAKQLLELRSQSTVISGQYRGYWFSGTADDGSVMPIGKYTLHFEASQERGPHIYRTMPIEIGRERFKMAVRDLGGMGGLEITFGAYNDRFNPSVFRNVPRR